MKTDLRTQKERHAPGMEAWRESIPPELSDGGTFPEGDAGKVEAIPDAIELMVLTSSTPKVRNRHEKERSFVRCPGIHFGHHSYHAASLIVVCRRYDQSTSGRKYSHRTSPAVAFSISGQCSAGTLFRRSQLLITCGAHWIRLANALCDPRWLIAFCSAVMRNILNTCLGNVNTWGLYH